MDLIREFARGLYWEVASIWSWARKHWAVTMAILIVVICWARKQRRVNRHP
jgi:hypothetical protein